MIRQTSKKEKQKIDEAIIRVLETMDVFGADSPEYPELLQHLDKLTTIQRAEKSDRKVSPDTMLLVLGNIMGIIIIVAYEQKHVIRSKATDFIMKAR